MTNTVLRGRRVQKAGQGEWRHSFDFSCEMHIRDAGGSSRSGDLPIMKCGSVHEWTPRHWRLRAQKAENTPSCKMAPVVAFQASRRWKSVRGAELLAPRPSPAAAHRSRGRALLADSGRPLAQAETHTWRARDCGVRSSAQIAWCNASRSRWALARLRTCPRGVRSYTAWTRCPAAREWK